MAKEIMYNLKSIFKYSPSISLNNLLQLAPESRKLISDTNKNNQEWLETFESGDKSLKKIILSNFEDKCTKLLKDNAESQINNIETMEWSLVCILKLLQHGLWSFDEIKLISESLIILSQTFFSKEFSGIFKEKFFYKIYKLKYIEDSLENIMVQMTQIIKALQEVTILIWVVVSDNQQTQTSIDQDDFWNLLNNLKFIFSGIRHQEMNTLEIEKMLEQNKQSDYTKFHKFGELEKDNQCFEFNFDLEKKFNLGWKQFDEAQGTKVTESDPHFTPEEKIKDFNEGYLRKLISRLNDQKTSIYEYPNMSQINPSIMMQNKAKLQYETHLQIQSDYCLWLKLTHEG